MTSVVMIFEMTQDYAVIVPLMISNLISLFIASRLQRKPIYDALAEQDGLHLPTAATRSMEGQRRVAQVMRPIGSTLPAGLTVGEAAGRIRSSNLAAAVIIDERGVVGVLSLAALEKSASAEQRLLDLVNPLEFPHVHADHGLHQVLERFGTNRLDLLPVVSRANVHQLVGVVTLRDVLDSYGLGQER
jgi:CIC family chloride channel protein